MVQGDEFNQRIEPIFSLSSIYFTLTPGRTGARIRLLDSQSLCSDSGF